MGRKETWFWERGSDGYIERVLVRNNGGRQRKRHEWKLEVAEKFWRASSRKSICNILVGFVWFLNSK